MAINIVLADYNNPEHARDIVFLLDSYANDPMGGGSGLLPEVKQNLVGALANRKDAFSILCYVDEQPAGLINCFEGFSTFACQPLMNIHDVTVLPEFRGQGLSHQMMAEVEALARFRGCCKLTLEVLEGNTVAIAAYQRQGFKGYELDPAKGRALFWEKKLHDTDV